MTTHIVDSGDHRSSLSIEHALRSLELPDGPVRSLNITAGSLSRAARRLEQRFRLTPQPLIDSWRACQVLRDKTNPSDTVVISDHRGLGGVFALLQQSLPPDERRAVWTIAADSKYLEMRLIGAVHSHLPSAIDAQIDWEIVQYNRSDRVISAGSLAAKELARLGVTSDVVGRGSESTIQAGPFDLRHVWLPGPVSRRSQTGAVLRALTSLDPGRVVASSEDQDDGVWTGSGWDAMKHARTLLGDRLERANGPQQGVTVVIVGDPYTPPDETLISMQAAGTPLIVPSGSVISNAWPSAPTWSDTDDLARVLMSGGTTTPSVHEDLRSAGLPAHSRGRRAKRISVGIPVFRDVRFLEECLDSILGQDLAPYEVIIVDDGSSSPEVDRMLATLERKDRRVRSMVVPHRGVSVARNRALEMMTGDSFLLIDSDDVLLPSFLSRCSETLNSDDRLWAAASWTEFFGAYEGIEAKPPFDARVGARENPIISTASLVEMNVRDLGIRFAPDLAFLFCEDWHFWSQIVAAGGRFGLVPEALIRHRVHPSSGGHLRTDLAQAIGHARAIEPLNSQ
jgi:GT2 family glycosyltransferase